MKLIIQEYCGLDNLRTRNGFSLSIWIQRHWWYMASITINRFDLTFTFITSSFNPNNFPSPVYNLLKNRIDKNSIYNINVTKIELTYITKNLDTNESKLFTE